MATPLNQKHLFNLVLRAIDLCGWQALILDAKKPFVSVFLTVMIKVLMFVFIYGIVHMAEERLALKMNIVCNLPG